ncbi:hypothetical protein [Dyadobacter sp. CY312]|uniref:hypothetical protein n=1 Tax=Dyadobacter sp. CY312 TaxID=2907303 RepID=UPI001F328005|nr:hypothetical protein [Dyadobacter sp. CY312]MCE7042044.1 hypothetical protein [Dyadobacter sp. CY312]
MRKLLVGLLFLSLFIFLLFLYHVKFYECDLEGSKIKKDTTNEQASKSKINDFPVEGQWLTTSCWAASLSMASKYLAPDSIRLNQCYFITEKAKKSIGYATVCGCIPFVNGKHLDTLKTLHASETKPCMYLDSSYPNVSADINTIAVLSSHITKDVSRISNKPLSISELKSKLSDSKPVLHSYAMGIAVNEKELKHVVLLTNMQTPLYKKSEEMDHMHLLNVKNPWPQGSGSEYFMTYEQYYLQYLGTSIYYGEQIQNTKTRDSETYEYMETRVSKNLLSNDPKSIAKQFVSHLKKLDYNETNRIFLKKTGFQGSEFPDLTTTLDDQASIPVVKLTVTPKSDVYIHNDTLQLEDIINERDFNQLIYFVRHKKKPVAAAWVSQKVNFEGELKNKKEFGDKWYLSQIESAQRFTLDSNTQYFAPYISTTIIRPEIVLIQMDGEINAEILATPVIANKRYRVIKIIKKSGTPFATTHRVR